MPVWIRAAVFIAIAPGMVAGVIPWYLAGQNLRPPGDIRPVQWIGLVLVVVGWSILLWCARDFARKGRGTPAPYDPPRALVTSGLYRFTRNPMYVGVVTAIMGEALWFWSRPVLVYGMCFAIGFHLRVLLVEEPRLSTLFGDDYAAYRAHVPRWLPRFPGARQAKELT